LGALFANPALMNMATTLMSDPSMQNLMGGLMSNAFGGAPPGAANASTPTGDANTQSGQDGQSGAGVPPAAAAASDVPNPNPNAGPTPPGLDALLQAGQRIAQQMQSANPELVEQLRNAMGGPRAPEDNQNNDQQQ